MKLFFSSNNEEHFLNELKKNGKKFFKNVTPSSLNSSFKLYEHIHLKEMYSYCLNVLYRKPIGVSYKAFIQFQVLMSEYFFFFFLHDFGNGICGKERQKTNLFLFLTIFI